MSHRVAFRTVVRRWCRFFVFPFRDQVIIIEAICLSAVARLLVWLLPFRSFAGWLGEAHAETPFDQNFTEQEKATMGRIGWVVPLVSRNVPWQSMCWVQALMAASMLRRRGIGGTVYFGLAKEGVEGRLRAHAWLRCGTFVITGEDGAESHQKVSSFAFVPSFSLVRAT